MELFQYPAHRLAQLLQDKACSAVEILQSVEQRIASVEGDVGAFVTQTHDLALAQAKQADALLAAGAAPSPLTGIPIGIKDNICTKDQKTTCSSKMLASFAPPYNATVVDKLNEAGLVTVGKLNMDEFAMGSSNETSFFHPTKNPHDLTRVPGGSSGGSAACVAAGQLPLSLGSDTGGSIRLPASYCGVIGLKPTYGTVSRYGLIAFASSLDQIGPLARSVQDVALLYDLIRGHDPRDATSLRRSDPPVAPTLTDDATTLSGLTIGLPREYFSDGVSDVVKRAVKQAADRLVKQGATLVECSLPSSTYALSAYYIISSAEASSNLARFDGVKYGYRAEDYQGLVDLYEKSRSEGFGDEVKRRILLGTFVLSSGYYDAYYKRAKLLQQQIAAEFDQAFLQCDLLLTPTAPDTAFLCGEHLSDPLKMYAKDLCTTTANIAGLPALSFPCGKDEQNLPIGAQLIGPKYAEATLLRTAFSYEQAQGGDLCDLPLLGLTPTDSVSKGGSSHASR